MPATSSSSGAVNESAVAFKVAADVVGPGPRYFAGIRKALADQSPHLPATAECSGPGPIMPAGSKNVIQDLRA